MRLFCGPTRLWGLWAALCLAAPAAAQTAPPVPWLAIVPPGQTRPPPEPDRCDSPLCRQLAGQLARGCGRTEDVPYADTVFLRRGLTPALDPDLERAIRLAGLAQDPDATASLLTPHLSGPEPMDRYAAALHLALILHRAGAPLTSGPGATALAAMRRDADAVEALGVPASDLHFLTAVAAGSGDAARLALARALQAEPRFFNALALALSLQADHARRVQGQGRSLCRTAYRDLLGLAGAMMDLEPCATQAAHLDIYFSRGQGRPDADAPALAVRLYAALLARRPGAARAALDGFVAVPAPLCSAEVAGTLADLLQVAERAR